MLTESERNEAEYNCRDVLSMCRMYPHLAEALDQTYVAHVYEIDEQMADLALQMTRIGLPVDSELRQAIGERLRALRDSAIEVLRGYTEGEYREGFSAWVAWFFASKARRGEPVAGSVRVGPTRAQAAVDEYVQARKEWKAYLKNLPGGDEVQQALATIAEIEVALALAKLDLKAARFETDECDGLAHAAESAFDHRVRIRSADFELALAKRGVNFGAKVQQAAILRVAGVPLLKTTGKSNLPQIDKEVLKSFERHPAAKALLKYILTEKTINVYIEGEKRAGKSGGKAKPVMVTEDGYIHPLWSVHKITGRWGSSPNCFDGETRLYVRHRLSASKPGWNVSWMRIDTFVRAHSLVGTDGCEVAQYNPASGNVEWVTPSNLFEARHVGQLVKIASAGVDLCVTTDHRLLTMTDAAFAQPHTVNSCMNFATAKAIQFSDPSAVVLLNDACLDQKMLAFWPGSEVDTWIPGLVPISKVETQLITTYVGPVFCLSVPSSYVVVKRNDKVCVAGQCQNWSKRAGGGEENLRAMICAPEGYTFIGADQKQLEARLIGAMSQCQYLLDVFKRGEDVHSAFAAVGFPEVWPKLAATYKAHKGREKCGCVSCAERDRVRDLTKRMEYGVVYGGSDKAIWEALVGDFSALTQQQVRVFIAKCNEILPEVMLWREQTLREAVHIGEIRSPILGRRQVFPLGRVDPTVAYNYKAQSGGADLWALGALDFCARWNQTNQVDVRLTHNGHDSVLVLCRRDLASQVERDVYECWSREWAEMPFEMETKIADRWSAT